MINEVLASSESRLESFGNGANRLCNCREEVKLCNGVVLWISLRTLGLGLSAFPVAMKCQPLLCVNAVAPLVSTLTTPPSRALSHLAFIHHDLFSPQGGRCVLRKSTFSILVNRMLVVATRT